jgi:hypothetical protein
MLIAQSKLASTQSQKSWQKPRKKSTLAMTSNNLKAKWAENARFVMFAVLAKCLSTTCLRAS